MKRLIFFTIILVAATAFITVKYFKSLNTSGIHAGNVMRTIPDSAAMVFEFTNDKGFYDIFTDNSLLGNLIGEQKIGELDTLRKTLAGNPVLSQFFDNSNIFISLHPAAGNDIQLLLTAAASNDANLAGIDLLEKQKNAGFLITPLSIGEKKGYTIYITSLKKRFFIINTEENIYSASFSKEMVTKAAGYTPDKEKQAFLVLPDKQNANSLANLYVNYEQLQPLFDQLFVNHNNDMLKGLRLLPALAALNLNYKSDALMFNGYTVLQNGKPASYLNLFVKQTPIEDHIKEVFPSTVAYAVNMAVSDPLMFFADLADFHNRAGLKTEKDTLFKRVKTETGINLQQEFSKLVGNEFAVVTTRYREKFGIISVKDGARLRPFMTNISTMVNDETGEFNYNKLPYFLLGDAFNSFRRPYFRIIDNYLILANSLKELDSYNDTYFNRKFLTKSEQYISFDNLLAEKSNVSFFVNFRNSQLILKNDLKGGFYDAYKNNKLSLNNFYGASFQLAAVDKNFYTNFCMLKNAPDTLNRQKNN